MGLLLNCKFLCSHYFLYIILNCINSAWNWTNWDKCLIIFHRFFLHRALWLIAFKWYFIFLANGNRTKHVPIPKIAKHLIVSIKLNPSMYCVNRAIGYTVRFFVSNGNLSIDLKKKMRFAEMVDRIWWIKVITGFTIPHGIC